MRKLLEKEEVVDEEILFTLCKLRALERKHSKIKFLERRLKEEMDAYEKLQNLQF